MKISTSILDSQNRLETTKKLNNTITNYIHIDVMDGKFVSNTQFNNINEIININNVSIHKLDIHLMVENPLSYINNYSNLNIEYLTFHIETNQNINQIISTIKKQKYKVGISLKPSTNINELIPYLKNIDLIQIMSVEPGQGGQEFLTSTTKRITQIKQLITKYNPKIKISVDGGINNNTIKYLQDIDIAVVGKYIINSTNYNQQIKKLLH